MSTPEFSRSIDRRSLTERPVELAALSERVDEPRMFSIALVIFLEGLEMTSARFGAGPGF